MKTTVCICCLLLLLGTLAPIIAAQSWTSNAPLPRVASSAVIDPSTGQMIIYGGFSLGTNSTQNFNGDVWRLLPSASLSGLQNWVAVHPSGTPPTPRSGHFSGYDPASNQMIVFGGEFAFSQQCTNEVWVLTNANGNGGLPTWNQLNPSGSLPPPRVYFGGACDPISNTLMVYGGYDCSNHTYSDYWVLSHANGLGGTPTWNQLFPASGPGPRSSFTMVYDPTSNELILFSGSNGSGGINNEVWVLTNANGTVGVPAWDQLFPVGNPPQPRHNSSATYDPVSNRMTVFAGLTTSLSGDSWVLTNANATGGTAAWIQIAQSSVNYPAPRDGHTAVYDASRNVMIVFGGLTSIPALLATNDVFLLSHANGQ